MLRRLRARKLRKHRSSCSSYAKLKVTTLQQLVLKVIIKLMRKMITLLDSLLRKMDK